MLEQRIKGCFWMLGALLMASNVGLFLAYLNVELRFGLFGLNPETTVYIYILGIPSAFFYAMGPLREVILNAHAPSLWRCSKTSLRMTVLYGLTAMAIYFFMKDTAVSRAFVLGFLPVFLVFNFFLTYFAPPVILHFFWGRNKSHLRAILYGHGPLPEDLRSYILRARSMGIKMIGYYADEQLDLNGIEWLGNSRELLECEGGRKRLRADIAFTYTDNVTAPGFREAVDRCVRHGARVHIYSNLSNVFPDPVRMVSDGNVHFMSFFEEPLQNPLNQGCKRAMDILISLPVVLFLLPPLATAVWIGQRFQSPGPLFFKQTRYGINRRPFTILKFRTMHVQDKKHEGQQAGREDKRIYPLGRLLRKTSLDEFPQFFNALRGDMSVVGPRPHLTLHDEAFEKHYRRYRSRHFVKPGITGLAQVSGYRGETTDEEAIVGRVKYDLTYITQWSMLQENYIVLKTAWQVLRPPSSAY